MLKQSPNHQMSSPKSTRKCANFLRKFLNLFNIYLSLHGLACAVKLKLKCKNFILFSVSVILISINELNLLYSITDRLANWENTRNNIVFTIITILEFLLQIVFFLKRKKLTYLNYRMAKNYSTTLCPSKLKFRNYLVIIFCINDIYIISTVLVLYLTLTNSYFDGNYIYGYVKAPASTKLFIFSVFFRMWGFVSSFISIYFCCFCIALKVMVNSLKKRLQKGQSIGLNSLNDICTEISNLTNDINESLHDILLLVIVINLGRVFYHLHAILVLKSSVRHVLIFRILNVILNFIRFVVICKSASSVSKAGLELRRSIYNLKIKNDDKWEFFCLVTKVNEHFVEFKLLDSLILDQNLILAAIGSLVTYGIIIATFDENSKQ